VARLASLVANIARESRADLVLDIGSGQGHLACTLVFLHGLRVVAVDAVEPLTTACAVRAERLERLTHGCAFHGKLLAVLPARVSWGTRQGCAAIDALLRELCPVAQPRVLLVGLHACGDLSPAILRTFAELNCAVAVVVVPCCHNLLTEGSCSGEHAAAEHILLHTALAGGGLVASFSPGTDDSCANAPGFPMSAAVQSSGVAPLGRRARMLACQSSDRWKLMSVRQEEDASWFAPLCLLRAALRYLLIPKAPVHARRTRGCSAALFPGD
jgi:hypothetical protein